MEVFSNMATDDTVVVLLRPSPSFFKKFPPEVRNLVYEEYFRGNIVDCKKDKYGSAVGVFLANKQMNAEAKGAFFSMSEFRDTIQERLFNKLKTLTPGHRSRIKQVTLDITPDQDHHWIREIGTVAAESTAYDAQAELFEFSSSKDLPPNTEAQLKFTLYSSGGSLHDLTTSSPWLDYAKLAKPVFEQEREKQKGSDAESRMQGVIEELDETSSFFDQEHKEPLKCWGENYFEAKGKCNCPEKVTKMSGGGARSA